MTEPSPATDRSPGTEARPRWDPRLGVNALSSRDWSLRQDLDCYERLGIERISVYLPKLLDAGLDDAVDEITGRGLRVDGILAGRAFDLLDERSWPRTHDAMLTALDVAQSLGAGILQTTGGSGGGRPYEWAFERFVRAIAPVAAEAAAVGIRIALEPTRPQFAHVGFVHTLRDGVALASDLGLSLVPDTAHSWWEPGFTGLLSSGAPHFAVLQVADLAFTGPVLERLVPGDGALPIGSMLAAAVAGGFVGPFELEIIGSAIEREGYESAIARSLNYLTSLLAVADTALVR
jgi:sugar phosphate isomerase/epimerase